MPELRRPHTAAEGKRDLFVRHNFHAAGKETNSKVQKYNFGGIHYAFAQCCGYGLRRTQIITIRADWDASIAYWNLLLVELLSLNAEDDDDEDDEDEKGGEDKHDEGGHRRVQKCCDTH